MRFQTIIPAAKPLEAGVRVPGSKSLTNRALAVAALADGRSTLSGALFSDDTEYMIAALQALGLSVAANADDETIVIEGCGGHLPKTDAELFCGNSGTAIRFCTALCTLGNGSYGLDGVSRMHDRPIAELVDALRAAGAVVGYDDKDGFPPVRVRGGGLRGGGLIFDAPASSQYISAVLMVAPYARDDVFVELRRMVSMPYVTMTLEVMEAFSVSTLPKIEERAAKIIIPAPQRYVAREYAIEPDASNASYFMAAAAVVGGTVTIEGLGTKSVQGDVRFVDILERMGCCIDRGSHTLSVTGPLRGERLCGVDVDLNDMPDMAQTLAVVALFAVGSTTIRNVGNLRIKETDRLSAMAVELTKFGAQVEVVEDGLTIHPPHRVVPARVATYDDHRMAMSFAVAGLVIDGVEILDPTCVNKTFPDFFERLERMASK